MSQFPGLESSGAPEDKKIFFQGLEKCLEAFTSGEGRVVRKYSRLFSQLIGKRQDDEEETISWSSSEEDNGNAPLRNTSFGQRSKITRKLNSQINFDSRISAKENGRRITRAQFNRSGGHLSQDSLGFCSEGVTAKKTSVQKAHPAPENSESLLNVAILIAESQDLTACSSDLTTIPRTPRREHCTSDYDITSPVFKLNSSIKKRMKKRPRKSSRKNEDECSKDRVKTPCSPDTPPSLNINISANRRECDVQLTPESKTVDENYVITSPVLGRTALRSYTTITSRNGVGDPPVSPIMLKPARRKRRHNATVAVPASPILEPKKKAYERKRQKVGVLKGNSQSPENKTRSSSLATGLGIVELLPSFSHSECPVKRSLDFATDVRSRTQTRLDVRTQPSDDSPKDTTHQIEESIKDVRRPQRPNFSEKQKFEGEEASQGLLNATNHIEEVNSEELDLSILPRAVLRRPNRLSLRGPPGNKRGVDDFTPDLETIEESSQTQCLFRRELRERPRVSEASESKALAEHSVEELRIMPSQKTVILNQTNLIEEVCTEELDLPVYAKPYLTEKYFVPGGLSRNHEEGKLIHTVETSLTQGVQCSQSLLEKRMVGENQPQSNNASKSVKEVLEELHKEFHTKRASRSSDRELIISQSSTRSTDFVKSSSIGCPEIESTSSPIGRVNQETSGPTVGIVSKSSSTRSPVVSSPLVISSAGSSPDVRNTDVPFVILEDEYNAPPKRKSKKLDPSGIASRLQRLLNQRRSTARIWQYKCSKLSRLNNKGEGNITEEARGRVLEVLSVRTDYSHIVLFSKEDKGIHTNGKEFRGSILVVLDPGVVVRLAKVLSATKIKIFPPWQSMDFVDNDITVILGANIVEVLSTERDENLSPQNMSDKSTAVQKYACRCLSHTPPDVVILECWDGVQSVGIFDLLFPLAASSSTQLVQFDGNTSQLLQGPDPGSLKRRQTKYSIKALLSTQSTASHGKGVIALTVLRVLCYRQRSFGFATKTDTSLHWSIVGRDDSNEVCELILGQIQNLNAEKRCDWSDFISGRSLGKKYKFRGVAVSQRLDRSRFCAELDVVPEKQNIVYILAPANQFSFSNEESESAAWEPDISTLAIHVNDGTQENSTNKPARVSFVCRIFHVNEHALHVTDLSISPHLCSVVIKQSTFIPPVVLALVQKPKPTRILVYLQDVEASKGKIVADKYSRIIVLDDCGRAYPSDCCRRNWPASPQICSSLRGIKVQLPLFSPRSRPHNLVKLIDNEYLLNSAGCALCYIYAFAPDVMKQQTENFSNSWEYPAVEFLHLLPYQIDFCIVSDLDETSALMWPACGSCGSAVTTEVQNVHHCAQCSRECKQLIVHMSLIIFVQCPDFPNDVSIRVKDISVREARGKPIGPIRCEVTASYGGNFVLNEVPSSLWM